MISLSDVTRLEQDTRALRESDYRHGGELCLDRVRTRIRESVPMLTSNAAPEVLRRLHVAVADLRNLAGWVCFDAGLLSNAHNHFSHALALAGIARDDGLIANVCYRLGRVYLHHGHLDEALRYFDVGQIAASRSGDRLAASILTVNSAWACGKKGAEHSALTLLDRGYEQFNAADRTAVADWAKFFTEADLSALAGAVHTDLAGTVGRHHARTAVPLLTTAINGYGEDMVRSRTLSLILLSTDHLIEGDVEVGVGTGLRALASAGDIGSARVRDRFRPLAAQARKHGAHSGTRDLAERIDAGTATPAQNPP
ncbi:tetratricopeptide repeat protein [Lentzea sp. NPDC051213]|uniref:tetratricopeptide repeat protein n=1 Tax=Lentzea sp. NPDC051213 TaxID=3364126 RepID=UPI00379F39BC